MEEPINIDHELASGKSEPLDRDPFGRLQVGGIEIFESTVGARVSWGSDRSSIHVNTKLHPSREAARFAALRQAATQIGLVQALRTDTRVLLDQSKQHPDTINQVLRWQGLASLRDTDQQSLVQRVDPENQTFSQEFGRALDLFALTGKYPDALSPQVRDAISRIPQPNGQSLINYIASGHYLKFDCQNYERYLLPLLDELADLDNQTGRSQHFEYRPSQAQPIAANKEVVTEENITVKVDPFYGGYYRERACRYNPQTKQIVSKNGEKSVWQLEEAPDSESVMKTKRQYRGKIEPGQETLLKLPYGALPILESIKPPGVFNLMRDKFGVISLEPRVGVTSLQGSEFSFDFVISENDSNDLHEPPSGGEKWSTQHKLDSETQALLNDLSLQHRLSDLQKAREIVHYIHQKFRYPKDEAEIAEIDSIYLNSGDNLWITMMNTKVANCYWANIFRDELCKRLEIASRIVTGPYVSSKDPRFEFAVVEAPRVVKHAWGEIWDSRAKKWTHRGMDATPPKQEDACHDKQSDQSEPLEGDFGTQPNDQLELTPNEIELEYLLLKDETRNQQPNPTPDQRAIEQFQREKGVDYLKWQALEGWINEVNQTPIPPEMSITKRPSTLYQEWRNLFNLLYKKRQIPQPVFKGNVPQSEGDSLDDPVTAYIDIVSQNDDPSGYQKESQVQKEMVEVDEFDDDFVLDISGSMSGVAEVEMQKMVLSTSYNIMKINERFERSGNRSQMRTPLRIRTTQFNFGNEAAQLVGKDEVMSEQILLKLEESLKAQNENSQGLVLALENYVSSLDKPTLAQIKQGKRKKILTIVSDGDVTDKGDCIELIAQLRSQGIIVQGIGFGPASQDIRVVCHDPTDESAATVINDVRQATLIRHRLLLKHLSRL